MPTGRHNKDKGMAKNGRQATKPYIKASPQFTVTLPQGNDNQMPLNMSSNSYYKEIKAARAVFPTSSKFMGASKDTQKGGLSEI